MPRGLSLDRNAAMVTDPGFDTMPKPLSYHVDAILAIVGADGLFDPAEQGEMQRLMVGLQAIGAARMQQMGAEQEMGGDPNATSDFGSGDGTEEADNYGAEPGAEFIPGM